MPDKIKYIIGGVVGVAVLIIIILLGAKIKTLEKQNDDLTTENTVLGQKIDALTKEKKGLQDKVNSLGEEMSKLNQKKTELEQKFDLLVKDKDQLQKKVDELVNEKAKLENKVGEAAKQPVVPDDSYWAGVLKQKAAMELRAQALEDQVKMLKTAADQLLLDRNNLTLELSNVSRDSQDAQKTYEYNQKLADTLTQDLAREKMDKMDLAKRFDGLRTDNKILRQQLRSVSDSKVRLEKQLSELQAKNTTLESSLNNMEAFVKQQLFQMDTLRGELETNKGKKFIKKDASQYDLIPQDSTVGQSKESAVQLAPIVVRPQMSARLSAPETLQVSGQGRILSLDRDNNFAVVDLGKSHGVSLGDTFKVYRQGQRIAVLEVIQLRDKIAACDIKQETSPVQVGDAVQ